MQRDHWCDDIVLNMHAPTDDGNDGTDLVNLVDYVDISRAWESVVESI
jgi:hypothetical protein